MARIDLNTSEEEVHHVSSDPNEQEEEKSSGSQQQVKSDPDEVIPLPLVCLEENDDGTNKRLVQPKKGTPFGIESVDWRSERSFYDAKPSKCVEDNTATSVRKAKYSTDKRPTNGLSSDNRLIPSHSLRSKCNQSDTSTKRIQKRRGKCCMQDSEHCSDGDFAIMLSNIVQVI